MPPVLEIVPLAEQQLHPRLLSLAPRWWGREGWRVEWKERLSPWQISLAAFPSPLLSRGGLTSSHPFPNAPGISPSVLQTLCVRLGDEVLLMRTSACRKVTSLGKLGPGLKSNASS